MKSKKQLFVDLSIYFGDPEFAEKGLQAKGISNETYGRKSCIYINCGTPEERKNIDGFLAARGYKVNRNYNPGGPRTEVQVSYFKGENWNE
jgi:hypothetical protein